MAQNYNPADNFRLVFAILVCRYQNDQHRVYMVFQDRHGWHCQFLEADLKTPLPRN